jgi:hypothetical protein
MSPHRLAVPRRQIDPNCAPHLMTAVSPVARRTAGVRAFHMRQKRTLLSESGSALVGESGHHGLVTEKTETVVLSRPTGPAELALIEASE